MVNFTRFKKIALIATALAVVAFLLFNYFVPRMIVGMKGGIYSLIPSNLNAQKKTPSKYNLDYEHVSIRTKDNLKLYAYIIRTDPTKQKGTVIFIHGIRNCKESNLPRCKMLADSGYNSVVIDLRGHGESEGEFCTYGFYEKQDISILIDSISNISDLSKNIGIWGASLGGAIAIQAMAIDKRIKFGIVESTFSELEPIIHDYFALCFGFDIPFVTNYLIWRAENIADFKVDEVVPCQSARQITQPVLIAHGTKDDRINIKYGRNNYDNISSQDKEFFECPEADHENLGVVCGKEYNRMIFRFLNSLLEYDKQRSQ